MVPGAEIDEPQSSSASLGAEEFEVASTSHESFDAGTGVLLGRGRSEPVLLVIDSHESAAAPQSSSSLDGLLALGVAFLLLFPRGAAFAPVAQGLLDVVELEPQSSVAGGLLDLLRGVDRPLPLPGLGQSLAMCPS